MTFHTDRTAVGVRIIDRMTDSIIAFSDSDSDLDLSGGWGHNDDGLQVQHGPGRARASYGNRKFATCHESYV